MAHYVASVETLWNREVAFDYLAEFANIADWDPAVPHATTVGDDPLGDNARDGLRRRLLQLQPEVESSVGSATP